MRGKGIEDDVKVLGLSAGGSYHLLRWIRRGVVVVVVVMEGTWRRLIFDVKFEMLLTPKRRCLSCQVTVRYNSVEFRGAAWAGDRNAGLAAHGRPLQPALP